MKVTVQKTRINICKFDKNFLKKERYGMNGRN